MGFQTGLSGLNAASKNLDVIGNNVANANTVGFKQSQAQFADVYAASLIGAGSSTQVGSGTKLAAVAQQFTQGNISVTNNMLDMAINGQGFFRMDSNGALAYSRSGQFQMDRDGFIVTSQGSRLTGYAADAAGNIVPGAPVPLQISTANMMAQASAAVQVGLNLDSRSTVPAIGFNPDDPTSYNSSTSTTIYDSLGISHIATMYFVKAAAPPENTWSTYMTVNNLAPDGTVATASNTSLGSMTFTSVGLLDSTVPATVPLGTFTVTGGITFMDSSTPPQPNGSTQLQPLVLNFLSSTQFGAAFGVAALTQDGYTSGRLTGFSTGSDGVILGRYTNGESRALGQVALVNFTNPQGLQPLGGSQWGETTTSGTRLVGPPGSGSLGSLQSAAVEESNVDLTAELVNMITAQRVYQANAQTIKTQDALLQTLLNMR